ncbi:MAG: 50S ribosomal protein L5 [bacterium (Candidatus Ratteibacteria) CG_4_10_14_3_um_filter_41_18]|uniref:Large ribosomal subunit protein uL5 n=4 Tax=Candidatus Ratteibacteria TaxID=2979319 RepID=A0A2M7YF30_9BACT|nr:MAG: 50S ribosomal protein L5 [Candidatus Omnitrophica bacterium CG1_02_41_171]PIV63589.1 MAG: 50S ribosomal protein L5 [bacterium (Candidatus Ratteibacteria) CG01_land_8_20_14_3_00_40_19]PIW34257.1 MAG: 50S ribosomal protein L5 [bacterium (Candidatus Ratteibacteria) CG15_BIG_FIL_POST_REV_8_21_14_020_41_12]PIW74518.1 MAG: 50S ribosomal protein L5 [bacterium (Candidatus Ratteibacteria) CG_4_8_14_3_um_filter_41_36]PIX77251.1 MAG: 50S ribosomal protein L5 [bacterium (Candidatus Ratteibacteria) 
MARLFDYYKKDIIPKLKEQWGIKNSLGIPKVEKITVNVGINKRKYSPEMVEEIVKGLSQITGQKPALAPSKKTIASFNLRKGDIVGCMVTLRGLRMYEFLDRLINIALPRVRDFRGLSPNSFDGKGNYTLGLTEQLIFPEIDYDKAKHVYGMNITVTTTAGENEKARGLLKELGVPFSSK